MSLNISRDTIGAIRPVFVKVLELFTGGFGWSARATDRNTDGRTLPAGALLFVDEEARTAHPIKRGRTTEDYGSNATGIRIEPNHLFEVGDLVFISGGGTSAVIESITADDNEDYIVLSRGTLGTTAATGATMFEGTGATITGSANAIAAYDTTVEAGASVAALRRGTVFANRIQPVEDNDDLNDVTLLSDSN